MYNLFYSARCIQMSLYKSFLALALACAVTLSACGASTASSAAPAPTATASPAPTAEPTPEPTAVPPAASDSFSAFESGLDSLGISYQRVTMAAEYIGARTGYKYKTGEYNIELYQFDPDSDAYQQAVADNAVYMDGFGTMPAYIHDGLALLAVDGMPQSVVDLFNSL